MPLFQSVSALIPGLFLAAAVAIGPAHAIDAGRADGTLTVAGQSQPLTTAQVYRFHDHAGLGRHADRGAELRILITDTEVPADLLQEVELKGLVRHVQNAGVAAVLLTAPVDAGTGRFDAQVMRLPTAAGIPLLHVVALPGLELASGNHRLRGTARLAGDVAGFSLDARFDAPEFAETAPIADHHGEAAGACAPALALLDMEARLKTGDFAGARLRVTPAMLPQLVDLEARAADPAFFAQFTTRLPERALRQKQIVQCTLYPGRAYLVLRQATTSLLMLRQASPGAPWRVDD